MNLADCPVAADQIKNVLNSQQVQGIAAKLGVSTDNTVGNIAEFLPQIMDKLTPDGSLPGSDEMVTKGLDALKRKKFWK